MAPLAGSRMIKTLVALVVSLAAGTLALLWMETAPALPLVPVPLQALSHDEGVSAAYRVVRQTDVEIQYITWRNIVVHAVAEGEAAPEEKHHFLIGARGAGMEQLVRPTLLWRRQLEGDHVRMPGHAFNEDSIGICLTDDARSHGPSPEQLAALVEVVRALQVICQIPRDRVYLHSELGREDCPGPTFPAEAFRGRLIGSSRS